MAPKIICLRYIAGHWMANRTNYLDYSALYVLQAMSAQGLGDRRLKFDRCVFNSVDDAIAFQAAGYRIMQRGSSIKPRHLEQIAALGGRIIAYTEKEPGRKGKERHQRAIVFPDRMDGLIAGAHCLPAAGQEWLSKGNALSYWKRAVPNCSPALDRALKGFVARPTAANLDKLRVCVTMERRY